MIITNQQNSFPKFLPFQQPLIYRNLFSPRQLSLEGTGSTFYLKMHQKSFGGHALPRLAVGAYNTPPDPLVRKQEEGEGRGGRQGWIQKG